MAVTTAAIKEPLPTEHCSVCQVQPQVLSHLTLLTLPATADNKTQTRVVDVQFLITQPCRASLLTAKCLKLHPGHGRSLDGEASGLLQAASRRFTSHLSPKVKSVNLGLATI